MRSMTTVVAMVARCRVDSLHVLTKDSVVSGAQLCQNGCRFQQREHSMTLKDTSKVTSKYITTFLC